MSTLSRIPAGNGLCIIAAVLLLNISALGQRARKQGHSIGTVTTQGNLIVLELNANALGQTNLFDLDRCTLEFTPDGAGYRVRKLPLKWNAEFGPKLEGTGVTLHNFEFPFSGKKWDSFFVATTGAVIFGSGQQHVRGERVGTGFPMARFDQLANAASTIANTLPGISVFLKPRMSGSRYVKELADRVIITWDLTEPFGGIQDFTWKPTVNRFQLVLAKSGSIDMSYDQVAARDAIVGIYPIVKAGVEKSLVTLSGEPPSSSAAPYLDITNVKVAVVDSLFLKVVFEARAPVLKEGDPALAGISYRVYFDTQQPATNNENRVIWTVRGIGPRRNGAPEGGGTRYVAFGPGLSREVEARGNTISIKGLLPTRAQSAKHIFISAETEGSGSPGTIAGQVPVRAVTLTGIRNPEVHFASITSDDGPFSIVYEAFHYLTLPNPRDLSCTVINTLGDKFDFLAYYSDFRVDNQEAGTPSSGPRGGNVTGIGETQRGLSDYCSAGRFQWGFIQPVYVGSNQMQASPPPEVKTDNSHDIDFYEKQLAERGPEGMLPYNLAMSQIGHELGHRWAASVSAKVNGETIPLGPVHWTRGLQAPVPFPYQRPVEASAMGGGVWQDNFDGTFTQLDDDYYVPATGYSYLDLYLMGLISRSEVPDFFLLRNLVPAGRDKNGHPVFKADRVKVTIDDVIAAEGPRLPGVDQSQRKFNTGMVVIVEHGAQPSQELLERTAGIAKSWINYWAVVTGHRASMTTNPH